jgi:hypothetical protein
MLMHNRQPPFTVSDLYVPVVLIGGCVLAFRVLANSRQSDHVLLHVAAFLAILVIAGSVAIAPFSFRSPWENVWKTAAIVAGVEAVMLGVAWVVYRVRPLYPLMVQRLGLRPAQLVIASAVVAAGMCAYWFKRLNQRWYGIVEVLFGSISAISIASGLDPGQALFSRWAALAGCAYVVARGLNNYFESEKERIASEGYFR